MDQHFQYFYEQSGFGPAEFVEPFFEEVLTQYRGKVPDQMLLYWQRFGFCSFGKGLFWTVNPNDYASLVSMWLAGTDLLSRDSFYVLGRSAFGAIYLWGTKSGPSLTIDCPWGMIFPNDHTADIAEGKSQFLAQRFFGGGGKLLPTKRMMAEIYFSIVRCKAWDNSSRARCTALSLLWR